MVQGVHISIQLHNHCLLTALLQPDWAALGNGEPKGEVVRNPSKALPSREHPLPPTPQESRHIQIATQSRVTRPFPFPDDEDQTTVSTFRMVLVTGQAKQESFP